MDVILTKLVKQTKYRLLNTLRKAKHKINKLKLRMFKRKLKKIFVILKMIKTN